jgi:hypothetical protein
VDTLGLATIRNLQYLRRSGDVSVEQKVNVLWKTITLIRAPKVGTLGRKVPGKPGTFFDP